MNSNKVVLIDNDKIELIDLLVNTEVITANQKRDALFILRHLAGSKELKEKKRTHFAKWTFYVILALMPELIICCLYIEVPWIKLWFELITIIAIIIGFISLVKWADN